MIYNLKRNVFSERIYNKQGFLISKKLKPVVIIITLLIFTSVQNASGCTNPEADFSVDNTAPVVGQTVTFTDASANNDGHINSWSWVFGLNASPATATGQGPHQVSYSATGQKNVALTVSWPGEGFGDVSAGSNTETKTNFITVSEIPCPTITASVTGKTDVSCNAGADGTITVSASGGVAPYSYSVNNGTGWTASPANPYTFTNLVANEVYKIRVKDANGCESPVIP